MTGKAEIESQRKKLDATFKRAGSSKADFELYSDLAKYLCVLVSGFLEQAIIELLLEYIRIHSHVSVHQHVEPRLRQFTTAKTHRIIELFGSFDPNWRKDLEIFLVDQHKDAIDSVVANRQNIAHGKSVGITMARVQAYYDLVKEVVDHLADLCLP
jgi:hypothetical protein